MMRSRSRNVRESGHAVGDAGGALLLVVGWSAVLMIISLAVGQAVIGQIRTSDLNELSYQALAAAEAGVDEYRARLADYTTYDATTGLPTPTAAMSGWVEIPGGQSDAMYTYSVDTTLARTAGQLWISSTGRVGDATRTVEARVFKDGSYNYAFISNYSTFLPTYPDIYTGGGLTTSVVNEMCDRYWYSKGRRLSNDASNPWHRNSHFCETRFWGSSDRIYGPMHTNDVWYVNANASGPTIPNIDPLATPHQSGQVFNGPISSSCPNATSIDQSSGGAGMPGCTANHRYITSYDIQNAAGVKGTDTSSDFARSKSYGFLEIPQSFYSSPAVTSSTPLWNPVYKPPVNFVGSLPSVIQKAAETGGCVFSGPTRIRFYADGTLAVTSPDSKKLGTTNGNPWCNTDKVSGASVTLADTARGIQGTSNAAQDTTPKRMNTVYLDYNKMVEAGFNGVIYVQDTPTSTTDTGASMAADNYWSAPSGPAPTYGNEPSCRSKIYTGSKKVYYPWVIPDPGPGHTSSTPTSAAGATTYNDYSLYSSAGPTVNLGFPLQDTNLDTTSQPDPWSNPYGTKCKKGTVFVQGEYAGRFTLAAEGDIAITGNLRDATVTDTSCSLSHCGDELTYGRPNPLSNNVLGLVPTYYTYLLHPTSNTGGSGWINPSNWILNFATLSLAACLSVQDYNATPTMGNLTMVGSLGQKFGCDITGPANGNTAFNTFTLVYDERLARMAPPPFMSELSLQPWTLQQLTETPIRRDSIARTGIASRCFAFASPGGTSTSTVDVLTASLNVATYPELSGTTITGARVLSGPAAASAAVNGARIDFTYPKGVSTSLVEVQMRTPTGLRVAQNYTMQVGASCS